MAHKEIINIFKKTNRAVQSFGENFDRGALKQARKVKRVVKGTLTGGLREARGGELEANRKVRKRKKKK